MNRIATTILATALTAAAAGFITTGAAVAATPERVPELVSNTDTNGSDIKQVLRLSTDGRAPAWFALAAYPGSHGANGIGVYTGKRTDNGWKVTPYWPDTSLVQPGYDSLLGGYFFPGDLASMFGLTYGSFDARDNDVPDQPGPAGHIDAYKFDVDGSSTWISRPQGVPGGLGDALLAGLSEDGSTVFFTTPDRMTPDVPDGMSHLYRWRLGSVEAVGRDTAGELIGGAVLGNGMSPLNAAGDGSGGVVPDSFAVSSDGTRFVYRAPESDYSRTFLHEDGVGVSEISLSQRSGSVGQPAPTGAAVVAATPELRKIYLQSPDQLTDDAPVGGGDYVYDTETRELAFSNVDRSLDEIGIDSRGQRSGIVRVSDDGEYVYFLSSSALVSGGQADGRNLYLRHGGEVRLIAVLDPTEKDDGLAVGPKLGQTPSPEYTQSGLSADGTRLVFISSASLAGFDTGGFRSAYLYDSTTQNLKCISCRPGGGASEGEATLELPPYAYNTPIPRVISADGSIVGFASDDALVPEDTNGTTDVYEYRDGRVRLISAGTSRFPSTFAGLSPDGVDLYFMTRDSLSPEDANGGFSDLYDARVGGRRAPGRVPDLVCSGDDCQGRPTTHPATPSAGSVTFTGVGDQPGSPRTAAAGRSVTVAKLKTITGTAGTLKVKVPSAGALGVSGPGVASGKRTTTEAGTYALKVSLTSAAKRTLKRKATLTITARVVFTPKVGIAAATSVKVTFKQPRPGKRSVAAKGGR